MSTSLPGERSVARRDLLLVLGRYLERFPEDRERAAAVREFVAAHPDCFERSCPVGHVTGSAWVSSPDAASVVLVRHRKLDAWLQPGGHADGDPDPAAVALREAREETGLSTLAHSDWSGGGGPEPFDLDVHRIPARGGDPQHLHFDLRYLLIADPDERPAASAESDEVRWVRRVELERLSREPSLLRMAAKAVRLLGRTGRMPS